jgi:CMP-N,N'-diacetyllegionaminic acid synthase
MELIMNKKLKITALLTGRGNNTLKDKNIIKITGKAVLAYPCIASKKSKKIDNFFSSSDDNKILKISNQYGFTSIKRPKKISKQNTKHRDVLIHAISYLKKKEILPDIFVVLLANSITIKTKWIDDCIKLMEKNTKITAVVPVIKNNDHHPFRAKKIDKGYLKSYIKLKKNISTNRQELPGNYFLCHNFWVIKTKEILKNKGELPWKFMGNFVMPYVVDYSLDIHEQRDVHLSKEWLIKNFKSFRK